MGEDPVAAARRAGRSTLTEPETKRLLVDAGVSVPRFEVAASPDAAVAAADRVGYPAVVKVASAAVTHKSEWAGGVGVRLGLGSPDAVRDAAAAVLEAADDRGLDASVLVEAAVEDGGTEVIVGASRRPSFGPTVLVGAGGVFAEVYDDVAHRLAPLSRAEAHRAIGDLRTATLLGGYRTRPAADVDALAGAVVAVGDLIDDRAGLAALDANPVLATPDGAVALDAVAVLDDGGARPDDAEEGGRSEADGARSGPADGSDGGTGR